MAFFLLSAYLTEAVEEDANGLNVDGIVQKPVSLPTLGASLAREPP